MPTAVFKARYTSERILLMELQNLFPMTQIGLEFNRGQFFCEVPRRLTPDEKAAVKAAIKSPNHYEE